MKNIQFPRIVSDSDAPQIFVKVIKVTHVSVSMSLSYQNWFGDDSFKISVKNESSRMKKRKTMHGHFFERTYKNAVNRKLVTKLNVRNSWFEDHVEGSDIIHLDDRFAKVNKCTLSFKAGV